MPIRVNGAAGKCWKLLENDRIELENELISCKSRNDQLDIEKRKNHAELLEKQAQIESFETKNNDLTLENEAAKNELINCKSRIDQQTAELQELQAQLETSEQKKQALVKCELI